MTLSLRSYFMAFEHFDPSKPTLIAQGPQKISRDSWNGEVRRRAGRNQKNSEWKFKEVLVPTYQSNDKEIRLDGFYPSQN